MNSTKTTIAGISAILAGVAKALGEHQAGQPIDFVSLLTAVSVGLGLLAARDNSKSSEEVGAKGEGRE